MCLFFRESKLGFRLADLLKRGVIVVILLWVLPALSLSEIKQTINKNYAYSSILCSGHQLSESAFIRSSHLQIFYKTRVLKNFSKFTRKHLCWSLFLIKLRVGRHVTSLKRDSSTGVFL